MLATRKVLPQMRSTPTQKMRIDPTVERFAIAAAVMSGFRICARTVTPPCRRTTGMTEKMQPLPMDAVMVHTSSASMAPLSANVVQSPVRPS